MQRLFAGGSGGDFHFARVNGDGTAPLGRTDQHTVAADFEAGRLARLGHVDDQTRQTCLELFSALGRGLFALVLAAGARLRRDLQERGPGAGDAAALLVAVGQMELRANPRIEAIALLQLGTSFREASLLD